MVETGDGDAPLGPEGIERARLGANHLGAIAVDPEDARAAAGTAEHGDAPGFIPLANVEKLNYRVHYALTPTNCGTAFAAR
jgi:hypothetical protein